MKDYNYYHNLIKERNDLINEKRYNYNAISLIDSDDAISREALLNDIQYIEIRLNEIRTELQD